MDSGEYVSNKFLLYSWGSHFAPFKIAHEPVLVDREMQVAVRCSSLDGRW